MSRATYNNVKRNSVAYEILRKSEAETEFDEAGRAIAVNDERSVFKANLQPLTGKEIQSLPEGERTDERLNGWTIEAITQKDKLVLRGGVYSVRNIEFWPTHRGADGREFGYNKFVIVRTGDDTRKDPDA
jgi:hypothetical protein